MIEIYPPGTKEFTTRGTILKSCFDTVVKEVVNGNFDLSFKFRIADKHYRLLAEDWVLLADTPIGKQSFFIAELNKKNKHVEVYAKHTFFQLQFNLIEEMKGTYSGRNAVDYFFNHLKEPNLFTFRSDIYKTEDIEFEFENALDAFGNGKDSIVGKYGGCLKRDKYDIQLLQRRGEDTEYLIKNGKNVTDLNLEINNEKVVTKLYLSTEVDKKLLVPKPNGGSINWLIGTGKNMLEIIVKDKATGAVIDDDEMHFDIYDSNGNRVINNNQTGSKEAYASYREKRHRLQQRETDANNKLNGTRIKIAEQERKLNESIAKGSKADTIQKARDQLAKAKTAEQEAAAKLAEVRVELDKLKEPILGKRVYYDAGDGDYTMIMTKAPRFYYGQFEPVFLRLRYAESTSLTYVYYLDNENILNATDKIYRYATVTSPYADMYPEIRPQFMNVSNSTITTHTELAEYGKRVFEEERIDFPITPFKIKTNSEILDWGLDIDDTCRVFITTYGVDKKIVVTEYEYDPIVKKYISITFGDKSAGLKSNTLGKANDYADKRINRQKSDFELELQRAHDDFQARFQKLQEEALMDWQIAESQAAADIAVMKAEMEANFSIEWDLINDAIENDIEVVDNKLISLVPTVSALEAHKINIDSITIPKINESIQNTLNEVNGIKTNLSNDISSTIAIQMPNYLASYVKTDDYNSYKLQIDGLIASKVSSDDFTTYKTQQDGLISSKVESEDFNSYVLQTDKAIGAKANLIDLQGLVKFSDIDGTNATTVIDGGVIKTGTIKADQIGAGAISAEKIASETITAEQIAALTLTSAQIQAGSITGAKIAGNTITARNMKVDSALIDKLNTNNLLVDKIIANTAFVNYLDAIEISALQITTGKLWARDWSSYFDLDNGEISLSNGTLTVKNKEEDGRKNVDIKGGLRIHNSSGVKKIDMHSGGIYLHGDNAYDYMKLQFDGTNFSITNRYENRLFSAGERYESHWNKYFPLISHGTHYIAGDLYLPRFYLTDNGANIGYFKNKDGTDLFKFGIIPDGSARWNLVVYGNLLVTGDIKSNSNIYVGTRRL